MKIPKILEPVADSLRGFRGNARTCILVEPLWGISYNLFVPYASLYMLSLGVSEGGIGAIASLGKATDLPHLRPDILVGSDADLGLRARPQMVPRRGRT